MVCMYVNLHYMVQNEFYHKMFIQVSGQSILRRWNYLTPQMCYLNH